MEIRDLFQEHIPGNFALSKTTTLITMVVVRTQKRMRVFYARTLQRGFETRNVTSTSANRMGLSGQVGYNSGGIESPGGCCSAIFTPLGY